MFFNTAYKNVLYIIFLICYNLFYYDISSIFPQKSSSNFWIGKNYPCNFPQKIIIIREKMMFKFFCEGIVVIVQEEESIDDFLLNLR